MSTAAAAARAGSRARVVPLRRARVARARPLAVITGTTSGIGLVTSRELARSGYHVAMLCRDTSRADTVRSAILALEPRAQLSVLHCDLAELDSVRRCAMRLRRHYGPISVLVNNAGIVSMRRRLSHDGFELTFATNHLGPFLLTALLLDRMGSSGRIVNVASRIHFKARAGWPVLPREPAWYDPMAAYAWSKLANVLHTFSLARRLEGTGITANCLHPGVVDSRLLPAWLRRAKALLSREMIDVERGAATTLHLALSPALRGSSGGYFDERQQLQRAAPLAHEAQWREGLWNRSLALLREAGMPCLTFSGPAARVAVS